MCLGWSLQWMTTQDTPSLLNGVAIHNSAIASLSQNPDGISVQYILNMYHGYSTDYVLYPD